MDAQGGGKQHAANSFRTLRLALRTWPLDETEPTAPPTSPREQPGVAKARRRRASPAAENRQDRFVVEESADELLIRVRLDGAHRGNDDSKQPAVITQHNCELIGLKKRQFLDLVRAGTIPGGRLLGTRITAAKLDDVLRVVERAAAASTTSAQQPQHDDLDDIDAVLEEIGQQLRRRSR